MLCSILKTDAEICVDVNDANCSFSILLNSMAPMLCHFHLQVAKTKREIHSMKENRKNSFCVGWIDTENGMRSKKKNKTEDDIVR